MCRVSTDEEVYVGEHPHQSEANESAICQQVAGKESVPRTAGEPGTAASSNQETDGDSCQRVTDGAGHSAEYTCAARRCGEAVTLRP